MVFKAHGSGASIYIVDMGELVVRKAQGSGRNSSIVVNLENLGKAALIGMYTCIIYMPINAENLGKGIHTT